MAKRMLVNSPELKNEFEQKLEQNKDFQMILMLFLAGF
jgi:hypothetical protein